MTSHAWTAPIAELVAERGGDEFEAGERVWLRARRRCCCRSRVGSHRSGGSGGCARLLRLPAAAVLPARFMLLLLWILRPHACDDFLLESWSVLLAHLYVC